MRFAAVHKLSSYLMVAASLLALALSGEVEPWVIGATATAAFASYFFEPNERPFLRSRTFLFLWNAATLVVFGVTLLQAFAQDALTSGVRFLCFLVVNKLWNRRASRDYLQAYVVSFLMLVAGAALSSELGYAVCFLLYVVFSTWTLTLFHLRREMEENYLLKHSQDAESERVEVDRVLNSRRIVGGQFLLGTSLVSVGIFLVSALLFFLIPRVGFGLFAQGGRRGRPTAGFSDRVELGQYGRIKDNPQIVLRVELEQQPSTAQRFRGISFDKYEKGRWSRTNKVGNLGVRAAGGLYVLDEDPIGAGPQPKQRPSRERMKDAVKQVIYLEPLDTPVLFGLVRPVAYELGPPIAQGAVPILVETRGRDAYVVERRMQTDGRVVTVDRQGGLRYVAWSVEPHVDEKLAAAATLPETVPPEIRPYLQVPADLPPRITALAQALALTEPLPYGKARAIEKYLSTQLAYSLELQRDERYEPIEDFLFVQKKGHCEYFASSLAVMLRTLGIPARSVNGFYGGEWNEYGKYLAVRQGDAHAWVEAWFDGVGWVTFDPTPSGAPNASQSSALATMRRLFDTVELAWFKWVIDYDLAKQAQVVQQLWQYARSDRKSGGSESDLLQYKRPAAIGLFGIGLIVMIVWARRRPKKTDAPERRYPKLDKLLERLAAELARRGYGKAPGETWRALAARVAAHDDPIAPLLSSLVERYYAMRFGQEPMVLDELTKLATQVTRALAQKQPARPTSQAPGPPSQPTPPASHAH